jgi:peroxiredoxin
MTQSIAAMKRNLNLSFLLLLLSIFLWQCGGATVTNEASSATGSTTGGGPKVIAAAEAPNIQVRVQGLTSGKVRLLGTFADQQFLADTTTIAADGSFSFVRDEPYKQGAYWVVLPNESYFQLLLSEDQTMTLTTHINNLWGAMQVEGSLDNELLRQTQVYEQDFQAKAQGLSAEQRTPLMEARQQFLEGIFAANPNSFFTIFKRAGQNPLLRTDKPEEEQVYWYRMDFWKGFDFTDERLMYTPVVKNKLQRYFKEITPQQPDSIKASVDRLMAQLPYLKGSEFYKYFSNWITIQYEPTKTDLMDAEAVWVHMIQNYFTYDRAFWSDSSNTYALQLRAEEMANSLVGLPGPNVKAPDPNGQLRAIYDLKAPYIVVYLYNPDCEHCQEQTPVLVNLHRKWQSQPNPEVDVYAIAIDTEADIWKRYIQKTGMSWTNVFDPSNRSIYKTYFVNITPEVYLLGPDRKIIAKNLNVNQIEEAIRIDKAKN